VEAHAVNAAGGTTPWVRNVTTAPLVYSLAERDRRWRTVRERATAAGLDGIFVPLGNDPDARYLTQLRSSVVVLPSDGRPPIVLADRGARNEWVPEPRVAARAWAPAMADALREAGIERGRIGVVGLKGGRVTHVRLPEGVLNYTAFAEVQQRLPNATFVDATDVVGFVRYVKSEEEIEALRRSVSIAEAGIDAMVSVARPGLDAAVLFAAVMERLLVQGGSRPSLELAVSPVDQPPGQPYANPPLGKRLDRNDRLDVEVHAVWGGQRSGESQPLVLGPPPEAWKPLVALQKELFQTGLAHMQPGTTFGDVLDLADGLSRRHGLQTGIQLGGCGFGDAPLLEPGDSPAGIRDLAIERGNAFVCKPVVTSADGRHAFGWGGAVVVTERGAELLSKRRHGPVSIP
jgi:Xaa-Pro aminopeptidase